MRNLVAHRRAAWEVPAVEGTAGGGASEDAAAVAFAVNLVEEQVYVLHGTGRLEALATAADDHPHDGSVSTTTTVLALLDEHVPHAEDDNDVDEDDDRRRRRGRGRWRWIDYHSELELLVCGSIDGSLVTVHPITGDVEEIGAMDGGLRGLSWSSNQEVVALVTGAGAVLVMNATWDVLDEAPLPVPLAPNRGHHREPIDICWRDDGQFLVLNVPTPRTMTAAAGEQAERTVLVLTRDLALHGRGRLEDGRAISALGETVTWSPNHALIASHERRKDQLVVVFFERNGLRHGEFALPAAYPASTTDITAITWNARSEVLAVAVVTHGGSHRVLLWSRDNYHWFLKHELTLIHDHVELGPGAVATIQWDAECATVLHLLLRRPSGAFVYRQEEVAWETTVGERLVDGAAVVVTGVIDGSRVLLTPVHQALVPPPMSLHTLAFAASVNSMVFCSTSETLVALLSTGDLVVARAYLSPQPTLSLVHTDSTLSCLLGLQSVAPQRLHLAAKGGVDDALVLLSIDTATAGGTTMVLIPSRELTGVRRAAPVLPTAHDSDRSRRRRLAIQIHDGRCFAVDLAKRSDADADDEVPIEAISAPFAVFSRLQVLEADEESSDPIVIGLTATGRLQVDGVTIAKVACSSFAYCAHASALAYVTLGSAAELRLVPLSQLKTIKAAEVPWDDVTGESRVVERGARIVAVVGDRASVVLQMPRGNLEGIAPRLLVLALVVQRIEARDYAVALDMCRRHRLDLNLLVDFSSAAFLEHFEHQLVRALVASRPPGVASDRLCLFVTNLHDMDVWGTKYGPRLAPFRPPSRQSGHETEGGEGANASVDKVNRVCRAMMHAIDVITGDGDRVCATADDPLLLPYLTSAVKQCPPDYASALTRVQELLAREAVVAAKRAIKHLVFLTHIDRLYDEALGLYDIDLARFVASFSQRDPKEYATFLDAMVAVTDERLRRYRIDVHLGRHLRALRHLGELLTSLTDNEAASYEGDVMALVERGQLYDEALRLLTRSDRPAIRRLHDRVLERKAAFLTAGGHHESAGYVLLSIGAHEAAMEAFKSAGAWRMALMTATRAGVVAGPAFRNFAYEVARALRNQSTADGHAGIIAAARVYCEYCADVDEAVGLLVAHREWEEATRVASCYGRADLLETDVEPALVSAHEGLFEELTQREGEYVRLWTRLTTIREQKRLFKLHGIDGRRWEDGPDAEAMEGGAHSVASSVAESAASRTSLRSVGSHNSSRSAIGNFAIQGLAAATASHFYATQSLQGAGLDVSASAAAYKTKRYGGIPSRAERRRRIKQGSVEEEAHVAAELAAHAPGPALRREVDGVVRMLLFFGRGAQAESLERRLAALERLLADEYPMPTDNTEMVAAVPHVTDSLVWPWAQSREAL